jgi:hypothetical protein
MVYSSEDAVNEALAVLQHRRLPTDCGLSEIQFEPGGPYSIEVTLLPESTTSARGYLYPLHPEPCWYVVIRPFQGPIVSYPLLDADGVYTAHYVTVAEALDAALDELRRPPRSERSNSSC